MIDYNKFATKHKDKALFNYYKTLVTLGYFRILYEYCNVLFVTDYLKYYPVISKISQNSVFLQNYVYPLLMNKYLLIIKKHSYPVILKNYPVVFKILCISRYLKYVGD